MTATPLSRPAPAPGAFLLLIPSLALALAPQDMLTDVDMLTLVREAVAARVQARLAGAEAEGGK